MTDPYELILKQREFQVRILGGVAPYELSDVQKMAYIREQALALLDEVHEALAETGWKSWATSNHINREAFTGELADVYIFLMNLMLVAGITPTDLLHVVNGKIDKNHKRQDDGYDGVTTKCPACKRAYDDNAVKCTPVHSDPEVGAGAAWCDFNRIYVNKNGLDVHRVIS
jgi:NTP pyrophosphatase (non-canonical NTP hydrolase)